MSSCEKCWRDSTGDDHAVRYAELIEQRARFIRLRQFILANRGTGAHFAFGELALQCRTLADARAFDWLCTALEIYEAGDRADARTMLNFARGAYQPLAWASVGLTLPEYKALQESP